MITQESQIWLKYSCGQRPWGGMFEPVFTSLQVPFCPLLLSSSCGHSDLQPSAIIYSIKYMFKYTVYIYYRHIFSIPHFIFHAYVSNITKVYKIYIYPSTDHPVRVHIQVVYFSGWKCIFGMINFYPIYSMSGISSILLKAANTSTKTKLHRSSVFKFRLCSQSVLSDFVGIATQHIDRFSLFLPFYLHSFFLSFYHSFFWVVHPSHSSSHISLFSARPLMSTSCPCSCLYEAVQTWWTILMLSPSCFGS